MSNASTIVGLGARTDHVAAVPYADPLRLGLTPEETALFNVVGRVARIGDVIARSGLGENRAIAVLLSLRAKGAIAPARVQNQQAGPVEHVDAAALEEVELEPERKREILELERQMDRMDHFQVLGVAPGALPSDVKKAYYEASRRYHPDRYYGKNLGSFRVRIERIFKRLSDAHAVLTHPEKRAAYTKAHPELEPPPPPAPAPAAVSPVQAERQAERQARLARHPYLMRTHKLAGSVARAKVMLEAGDYERAFKELSQAQSLDPNNRELPGLIAMARRKHEAQRAKDEGEKAAALEKQSDLVGAASLYRRASTLDPQSALFAFKAAATGRAVGLELKEVRVLAERAVGLEPERPEHHFLLGAVLVESGAKKLAKRHFEETLKLEPEHSEAKAQLRKLRWSF